MLYLTLLLKRNKLTNYNFTYTVNDIHIPLADDLRDLPITFPKFSHIMW